MAMRLPTAHDAINVIKKLMADKGVDAFETKGRVQLYSGPLDFINEALDVISNHERAVVQAGQKSKLIDKTPVGTRLGAYKPNRTIYEYFAEIYGLDSDEAFYYADKVMRFASREFTKACYGHVETAVCGAGLDKVFFEVELPELIRNKRIETINDMPMQRFRDVYYTQGAYVAFREICKAELHMLQKRESANCSTEIKKDRKDRFVFFRKSNKEIFKKIKAGDKKIRTCLAPICPYVVTGKSIRFMIPKVLYVARSVQYG